jgi:hypothetical protein
MATAPESGDDLFDDFLSRRGHETEQGSWERDHNKKQCPECGGLHDLGATDCGVCGWTPN